MKPWHSLVFSAAVCTSPGCYDEHGLRDDASVDASVGDAGSTDARVGGGDARDTGVSHDRPAEPACTILGRAVAAIDGSATNVAGCACPPGTTAGIAFTAPAPLAVERGPFALCIAPRTNTRIVASGCRDGQVLHHYQGERSEAAGVDFTLDLLNGFGCLAPRDCLFGDGQLPLDMQGGCFYSDWSIAVTGVVPTVADCEDLTWRGLCAVNCPCGEGPADRRECFGLSESQPVGACGSAPLCEIETTCGSRDSCLYVTSLPAFSDDVELAFPAGRCVRNAGCDYLRERTGDLWTCYRE